MQCLNTRGGVTTIVAHYRFSLTYIICLLERCGHRGPGKTLNSTNHWLAPLLCRRKCQKSFGITIVMIVVATVCVVELFPASARPRGN
eukprot:1729854-Amphidinium_carterae.1